MPRLLHSLLLAVVTALLLLQPAVRAGASCAEELLTGACGCPAMASEVSEHACCAATAPASDAEAGSGGIGLRADTGCACELAPMPDAPARTVHERASATDADLRAAFETSAATPVLGAVRPAEPGVRAHDPAGGVTPPHDLASRAGAARFLTFLCTSRR